MNFTYDFFYNECGKKAFIASRLYCQLSNIDPIDLFFKAWEDDGCKMGEYQNREDIKLKAGYIRYVPNIPIDYQCKDRDGGLWVECEKDRATLACYIIEMEY